MLGVRKKLKINEYGVFDEGTRLSGEDETEIFEAVGLAFVPPELREDRGEIDAAREGNLPTLCTQTDLLGDVVDVGTAEHLDEHVTSLARGCHARGYSFVVVLGPREMAHAAGDALRHAFLRAVRDAQTRVKGLSVYAGVTVGVRRDGSLDATAEALDEMAVVRVELEDAHGMEEKARTAALLSALASGKVKVVARPTAVFQKEKLAQVDAEAIAKAAKKHGVAVELDARPERLASADGFARVVKGAGAKLLLASHATTAEELGRIRYGVDQARRGWIERADMANAEKVPEFVKG